MALCFVKSDSLCLSLRYKIRYNDASVEPVFSFFVFSPSSSLHFQWQKEEKGQKRKNKNCPQSILFSNVCIFWFLFCFLTYSIKFKIAKNAKCKQCTEQGVLAAPHPLTWLGIKWVMCCVQCFENVSQSKCIWFPLPSVCLFILTKEMNDCFCNCNTKLDFGKIFFFIS